MSSLQSVLTDARMSLDECKKRAAYWQSYAEKLRGIYTEAQLGSKSWCNTHLTAQAKAAVADPMSMIHDSCANSYKPLTPSGVYARMAVLNSNAACKKALDTYLIPATVYPEAHGVLCKVPLTELVASRRLLAIPCDSATICIGARWTDIYTMLRNIRRENFTAMQVAPTSAERPHLLTELLRVEYAKWQTDRQYLKSYALPVSVQIQHLIQYLDGKDLVLKSFKLPSNASVMAMVQTMLQCNTYVFPSQVIDEFTTNISI